MSDTYDICDECATAAGGRLSGGHSPTYHDGVCLRCGRTRAVTEVRDYGLRYDEPSGALLSRHRKVYPLGDTP